jgi:thiamine biosynthesis protein ThiI
MSDETISEGPRIATPRGLLLVRYGGDLTTKARPTRQRFSKRLAQNIKEALRAAGMRTQIERRHDRIHVELERESDAPIAAARIARVFGVQSVARVQEREWRTLDDLVRHGVELFGEAVKGRRFAVRARGVGDRDRIRVRSSDLARALGTALLERSAGVDLDRPEVTAGVEIGPGRAHFLQDVMPGPGGLPLGAEGRAVALVSGGFDSAVAAWQIQKRGVALDYVFCNLGGRAHQLGTLHVMKHVADEWSYGVRPRFHAIEFEDVSQDLQRACTPRYWQVVLKRLMLRAATRVANERGAVAIVTGEAIGQVSSQTLQNLSVISRATELPILRPLVGLNKDEILEVARRIGTFELSKVVGEYCALVPSKPSTAARLDVIDAEEARTDREMLDRAVDERSILDLRSIDLATLDDPDLQVDAIPDGATVIDLRSKTAYRSWHHPGSLPLEFAQAMAAYPSFDRSQRYALYCEFGLKSAHLAERMRDAGFDVVSYRHGAATLRRSQGASPADGGARESSPDVR